MRRLPFLVAALALALPAACGGKAPPPSAVPEAVREPTTTTVPPPPPISSLTGLPVKSADVLRRPVVAVKVENSPDARPQAGFENADLVYEEVVEGGITRFIMFFQSTDAELVGPIRSARPVDRDILVQFGRPVLAFAGGISTFVDALAAAGVALVTEDDGDDTGLTRRRDRYAPHNLYAATKDLRDFALKAGKTVSGIPLTAPFSFAGAGQAATTTSSTTPTSVVVDFSPDARMEWDYQAGSWVRYEGNGYAFLTEAGDSVKAANVLIMAVAEVSTGNVDASGSPVPSWQMVGSGSLTALLGNGHMVTGTWDRQSAGGLTQYLDSSGRPLLLTPGVTWIQLLPSDRGVTAS